MQIFLYLLVALTFHFNCIGQTTGNNYYSQKLENELWRALADSGKYNDAINILLDSLNTNKHKNNHGTYWHVGQLYACNNEYAFALKYIKKSTSFFDKLFDREWRLYYKGTIAFLKKDKEKLKIYNYKLWNKHSDYYYFNACKLNALYDNFDKPYLVAYNITCK